MRNLGLAAALLTVPAACAAAQQRESQAPTAGFFRQEAPPATAISDSTAIARLVASAIAPPESERDFDDLVVVIAPEPEVAAAWRPHLVRALNSSYRVSGQRGIGDPWRIHLWTVTSSGDSIVFRAGIYRCNAARPPMNAYEDVMDYQFVRRAEEWVLAEQRHFIHLDGECGLQR